MSVRTCARHSQTKTDFIKASRKKDETKTKKEEEKEKEKEKEENWLAEMKRTQKQPLQSSS